MEIYAFVTTVIAVIFIVLTLKWKIITRAIVLFCIEKFRKPTDEEIADCTKRTINKMLRKR